MNDTRDEAARTLTQLSGEDATQHSYDRDALGSRFLSPDPRTRLEGWQAYLAEHFSRIAAMRQGAGWPVFALEHGLNASQRDALMRDVRACAAAGPGHKIALPWVIYAAEIGYEYSGFEYWQTFESKTPGWQQQWRDRVRSRFEIFSATYHGAVPDGNWAHQFNIIAWPITHGILPRDLQRQLAELLYDASMSFNAATFSSAESLGSHLQKRCSNYSSRFRQFAENATLLGQIALALLLQDTADAPNGTAGVVLEADTLERIVNDLNRERDARQWLADARSAARFRVRGLSRIPLRGHHSDTGPSGDRTQELEADAEKQLRPRFLLREQESDQWRVRIELPNLGQWATRSLQVRDFLLRSQGRIAGATVPVLAKGRTLRDVAPTIPLSSWPDPQTQLLSFNGAPLELEALLRTRFRMETADHWLFVIRSDGQAHELSTRVLRSGASYLLLQRAETRNPVPGLGIRGVDIACVGVFGLRIDVPERVSEELAAVLAIIGLEVAQTLEVWPAGLPVPEWSGDGYAEWVGGQPILLGIRSDRRLARLTVSLDGIGLPEVRLESDGSIGDTTFVQLPALRPGRHHIRIAAQTLDNATQVTGSQACDDRAISGLSGDLSCVIREPRTAAMGQIGALSFAALPKAPSLEDIWEDRIDIHVAAPGASSVRCRVELLGSSQRVLLNRQLTLPSPCDTDTWRHYFDALRLAADELYDDTQACTITFESGALGRAIISAERDFRSLRWVARAHGRRAELVDLQGSGGVTAVAYRCSEPARELRLDALGAQSGVEVENEGRLLVARRGGQVAALVSVPRQNARDFSSLLVRPRVGPSGHSVAEIRRLISLAQLWEEARLGGSTLARARQQACIQAIISAAFGAITGRPWEAVEAQVRDGIDLRQVLDASALLVAPGKADEGTKAALARRLAQVGSLSEGVLEENFVSVIRWLTKDDRADHAARFALMLTASPLEACRWADDHPLGVGNAMDTVEGYLNYLNSAQFVARAARYVRLQRSSTSVHY